MSRSASPEICGARSMVAVVEGDAFAAAFVSMKAPELAVPVHGDSRAFAASARAPPTRNDVVLSRATETEGVTGGQAALRAHRQACGRPGPDWPATLSGRDQPPLPPCVRT